MEQSEAELCASAGQLLQAWKERRVLEAHRVLKTMLMAAGSNTSVNAALRAAIETDTADRPESVTVEEVESQAKQVLHEGYLPDNPHPACT